MDFPQSLKLAKLEKGGSHKWQRTPGFFQMTSESEKGKAALVNHGDFVLKTHAYDPSVCQLACYQQKSPGFADPEPCLILLRKSSHSSEEGKVTQEIPFLSPRKTEPDQIA